MGTMRDSIKFNVSNLLCSYNSQDVVVRIDSLQIPTNSIVFIVGPSGIGKSTLLETLGLMNNTIHNPEAASILFFEDEGHSVNLANSWSNSDSYLSALRARYFSFIFQETNLMPGFTAGQNLCMKMLIQGKTMQEARQQAIHFMAQLDLHEDIFDRMTHELSGGQRQRLAFLRAFLGDSQVLFCDEPTGNLDGLTAIRLMEILQRSIKVQKNSAAIVVSHDLSLAIRFADLIVPILQESRDVDPERRTGRINMDYVLTREKETWSTKGITAIENVEVHLRALYAKS